MIGRSLVPQLVQAGHEVTGTTRSAPKTGLIRDLGGHGVVADADRLEQHVVLAAGVHQQRGLEGRLRQAAE